ncbi:ABC transporter permease [Streptomyces sp. ME19-01-6]|uniref:ABC transporter permease n=1 Tax=Streptomyces sp. ME19-01-6 TaxID=3028686 RepID=UPI0029BCA639|nr:ABC transporter permease [Streptomyces sp. ME19-01-6]MDX3229690.1 ABC transporter permease [Streptomyces sp. ME19-01-6]
MTRYLAHRLLQAVLVLWAAFTTSFVVLYLLPGDPVSIMAAGGADTNDISQEQLAEVKRAYGFDKPLIEQYGTRLWGALHGDFGISVQSGDPVGHLIAGQLPATLQLTGAGLLLATVFGAGVALAATYTRRRRLRQALLSLPALAVSAPPFWVGLVLVQVVSFRWGLLPAIGNEGVGSLVLPAITLALPTGAVLAQVFAKSLRRTLAEPYVETAPAKGASRRRVHFGHAARNAALPPLTVAGVLVVLANLVVDLVYPLLDPRITTARKASAVAR